MLNEASRERADAVMVRIMKKAHVPDGLVRVPIDLCTVQDTARVILRRTGAVRYGFGVWAYLEISSVRCVVSLSRLRVVWVAEGAGRT